MTDETVEAVKTALGRFASERPAAKRLLLGVSGGPDSLALLLAAAALPLDVCVATVDHGLRAEAAGEARFVAAVCRDLGLPHRTLAWRSGEVVQGNLMAAAREARYRLLGAEAIRVGADAILVAHHADDQIETHRLARERGASGAALAGMRLWRDLEPDLVLIRPFLDMPKRALIDAVARAGLSPVEDPTNADMRYRRARIRAELAGDRRQVAERRSAIAFAAKIRAAEDAATAAMIRQAGEEGRLRVDDAGAVSFEPAPGDEALWPRILTAAGGAPHPPERAAVDRLRDALASGGRAATLGGSRVERAGGRLTVRREYGRIGPPGVDVAAGGRPLFDRRFTISGSDETGAVRLEPLGRLGLGGPVSRTLPVGIDRDGGVCAVHPRLGDRFPGVPTLRPRPCVAWRVTADLPGGTGDRLTADPQNAANPAKAVGKDLAATYLR
ncbi:tRNA lysidine(34) synthetase TilS [uncultured Aureimonas sp.]|uniref:tRNA lysidine(34) synthetase TilS n=1 Tax=uncultured Aureimonas sp. TaxID=1604662 RepID=UPI0025DBBC93|nr:tRNA lysidine(34) synthetase TilS [uncultured Aureimonas sp.]